MTSRQDLCVMFARLTSPAVTCHKARCDAGGSSNKKQTNISICIYICVCVCTKGKYLFMPFDELRRGGCDGMQPLPSAAQELRQTQAQATLPDTRHASSHALVGGIAPSAHCAVYVRRYIDINSQILTQLHNQT
jgi:hypothetical protein